MAGSRTRHAPHTILTLLGVWLVLMPAIGAAQTVDHSTFATSDQCIACHSDLLDSNGNNVSIGHLWRGSMMAHSALDPYWQAAVRREVIDHPQAQAEIEDTCSTCHMPMARTLARADGGLGKIFEWLDAARRGEESAKLALDGVSCTTCHQIQPDNFGEEASFDGGFVIRSGSEPRVFGPFEVDDGLRRVMQSASSFVPEASNHVQQSELCATCHTLFTASLDSAGRTTSRFPRTNALSRMAAQRFRGGEELPGLPHARSRFGADILGAWRAAGKFLAACVSGRQRVHVEAARPVSG